MQWFGVMVLSVWDVFLKTILVLRSLCIMGPNVLGFSLYCQVIHQVSAVFPLVRFTNLEEASVFIFSKNKSSEKPYLKTFLFRFIPHLWNFGFGRTFIQVIKSDISMLLGANCGILLNLGHIFMVETILYNQVWSRRS